MNLKFMVKSPLLGHDWDSQVKEGCGQGASHPLVDWLGAEEPLLICRLSNMPRSRLG